MTLLQQMHAERLAAREALRMSVREQLRATLRTFLPKTSVVVFGSLAKPGRFYEFSDVDLAFEAEPRGWSVYGLTTRLAEELGRPVDVILLSDCHFRDRLEREGERWTPKD